MEIHDQALEIINSFSAVSEKLILKEDELVAKSPSTDIVGRFVPAKGEIEIDKEVGIESKQFLSILNLFDAYKLQQKDDMVTVLGSKQKIQYMTLYTEQLPTYNPKGEELFDSVEETSLSFTLDDATIVETLKKHASTIGADVVKLKAVKKKAFIVLSNTTTGTTSEIQLEDCIIGHDFEITLTETGNKPFFTVLYEGTYSVVVKKADIKGNTIYLTKLSHSELANKKDGVLYYFIKSTD